MAVTQASSNALSGAQPGTSHPRHNTFDARSFAALSGVHDKLAGAHPKLALGQVWCRSCGATRKVDSGACLRLGWPKCCGYTMTIDAPDER